MMFHRFAGLRRIGIDEISYKRHHKYLTVVVDHDTGRLLWAAPGRDKATLRGFFDALGDQRAAQITHVSADAAEWIAAVITERCPAAVLCADPFHVVAWATEALDAERRRAWNDARALARTEPRRGRGRPARDAAPRPAIVATGNPGCLMQIGAGMRRAGIEARGVHPVDLLDAALPTCRATTRRSRIIAKLACGTRRHSRGRGDAARAGRAGAS